MAQSLAFEVHLAAPYDAALDEVAAALKTEGFGILTRIDVKSTLKEKLGEAFRPYAILGACNPPFAHRALAHQPLAGLLLPCNVTVEADPQGGSLVRIGDPETLLSVGGLDRDPVLHGIAVEVREKLARVAELLRRPAARGAA
jgi:uncharacterized protein (DUF302 family)